MLLKYEWTPGQPSAIETIPAIVIRAALDPDTRHYRVNVVPFGDGLPQGVWPAPVDGIGASLAGLYLFDCLDGIVPDVAAYPGRGMFSTRRVWCEWEGNCVGDVGQAR